MTIEKQPVSEVWAPFSFGELTPHVKHIKSQLLNGHSVIIEHVYADSSTGFLVITYDHGEWSLEEIIDTSFLDGGLGTHELHGLSVLSLGSVNYETRLIDETLSAGFIVCLLSDVSKDGRVVGSYMIRASVSDNS